MIDTLLEYIHKADNPSTGLLNFYFDFGNEYLEDIVIEVPWEIKVEFGLPIMKSWLCFSFNSSKAFNIIADRFYFICIFIKHKGGGRKYIRYLLLSNKEVMDIIKHYSYEKSNH